MLFCNPELQPTKAESRRPEIRESGDPGFLNFELW
jgi:hypothetical protein